MSRRWRAVACLLLAACAARPEQRRTVSVTPPAHPTAPPRAEVPEFRLPRTFVPSAYRARLAIEERSFAGEIEIDGVLHDATDLIWLHALDLVIAHAAATRGDQTVALQARTDRGFLALHSASPLAPGRWTLHLTYVGMAREQKTDCTPNWPTEPCSDDVSYGLFSEHVDNGAYWFTNFEPNGARRVFPCFDEPDFKVPWQLTLIAPKGSVAASNAPLVQHTAVDDKHERFEFEATRPLSSYLVAFAVGPFDVVDARATRAGIPIRVLVPHGQARAAATLVATTPELVERIAAWLDVPFPYAKLDLVAVPFVGQRWLAMENAGLITFGASVLGFARRWSTEIASHEIAHQWFGDMVTPSWWDDVWLNEGFATWMSNKITAQVEGDLFETRRRVDHLAIRAPINRTKRDITIFPYLDGQRGAELITMLENFLGEPALQRALHDYLNAHSDGLVTSADLIRAANAAYGQPLDQVFASYLDRSSLPEVIVGIACTSDRRQLELTAHPADWTVPVCVTYDRDGKRDRVCRLVGSTIDIEIPAKRCPEWVLPTAGLYRVSWTDRELHGLLAKWKLLDRTDRRQLLDELGERPEASQLAVAPLLVETGDRDAIDLAIEVLTRLARLVPVDLDVRWNAWVNTHFAAEARAAKFDMNDDDPANEHARRVVRLVATTGDAELASRALAHVEAVKQRWSPLGETILRLAANSTPDLATSMLASAPRLDVSARYQLLGALAQMRGILDLIKADPRGIEALLPSDQAYLLTGACDRAERDKVEEIIKLLAGSVPKQPVLAAIDACITRRAKLEPIFRAWLAKPQRP